MPNPSGLCECGCGERTAVAPRTDLQKKWVKGEHLRFAGPGHNATVTNHPYRMANAEDWTVEDCGFRSPCWVWLHRLNHLGYAVVMIGKKRMGAHRAVYIQFGGPVPARHSLHHLCTNPSCVNPDHLLPLTRPQHTRIHRLVTLGRLPGEILSHPDEILAIVAA